MTRTETKQQATTREGRTMIRKLAAAASGLVLALAAGCSAGGPQEPTPEPGGQEPSLALSVPETVTVGSRMQVVIESQGLEGEKATLYQFEQGFTEDEPTCREDPETREVTLQSGPQTVDLPAETPGDVWFVLSAGEMTTECAADGSVTRAMMSPTGELRLEDRSTVELGQISYYVGVSEAPPKPVKAWKLTTTWHGPYKTIPDAEAASCEESDISTSSKITKASGQTGDNQQQTRVKITEPGVYRVTWQVAGTPWSVPSERECGESVIVVVGEEQ